MLARFICRAIGSKRIHVTGILIDDEDASRGRVF
jgi:hypothetical protein